MKLRDKLAIIGHVLNDVRSSASYNPTLTTYAQGVAQDIDTSDADFLSPQVPVATSTGYYKSWSAKDLLQMPETERPIGGKPNRITFAASDPTYNCTPHGLEAVVDDEERPAGQDNSPVSIDEVKIRGVVDASRRARLNRVLTTIRASVSAQSGRGQWSDPDKDPIAEIDEQIFNIAKTTGILPNRMWIDMIAWNKLAHHPKVIARQPGAEVVNMNTVKLQSMLSNNPALEIKVGVAVYDQNKRGNSKNATFIGNGDVFVFYANPMPTVFDPSFAKTFGKGLAGIDQVKTYREEPTNDVHAVLWSEQNKVTTSDVARRITVSD